MASTDDTLKTPGSGEKARSLLDAYFAPSSKTEPIRKAHADPSVCKKQSDSSTTKETKKLSYFEFIKASGGVQVCGTTEKGKELYLRIAANYRDDLYIDS